MVRIVNDQERALIEDFKRRKQRTLRAAFLALAGLAYMAITAYAGGAGGETSFLGMSMAGHIILGLIFLVGGLWPSRFITGVRAAANFH